MQSVQTRTIYIREIHQYNRERGLVTKIKQKLTMNSPATPKPVDQHWFT